MEVTEIDGVKVVQEFTVLWHEWECDGYGWITEDGRAWLTTHGRRYEAKTGELLERLEAALSSAEGIRKALAMMADVRENAATSEPPQAHRHRPATPRIRRLTKPQPGNTHEQRKEHTK